MAQRYLQETKNKQQHVVFLLQVYIYFRYQFEKI